MNVRAGLSLAILLTLTACTTATSTQSPAAAVAADTDQDSVPDELDQCAQTRMPQPVDDMGCAVFQGALSNVDFAANSADLGRASRMSLDDLVALLNTHPGVIVTVDGHTDNRGSGIRNLALSKERVLAVVRYLVARGVNPKQLRPFAYGESRPAVSNASADGRRQNRRIEVSVLFPARDAAPAIGSHNDLSTEPEIRTNIAPAPNDQLQNQEAQIQEAQNEQPQNEQLVESGASDN